MAIVKAAGYFNAATAAQANQIVYNRGVWDCTVQTADDIVLIGKLPAGHRLVPELCSVYGNALTPAVNVDVAINAGLDVILPLIEGFALVGSTAARAEPADPLVADTLAETLGVDYENDRDVMLVINSGAATAPVGAKVITKIATYAASSPD